MKSYGIKNISAILATVLTLFLAASCADGAEGTAPPDGQPTVGIRLSVSMDSAPSTRATTEKTGAVSRGLNVDKLICGVYDVDGNLLKQFGTTADGLIVYENLTAAEWPVSIELQLMRNQAYKIALWAQSGACTAYDTSDLSAVRIDYEGLNNDELRDAFCASETFTAVGSLSRAVVLRRPFAQVNVGIRKYDYEDAVAAGYRIVKSQITIRNAATCLDVVNNAVEVSGEGSSVPVTYGYATIPAEQYDPEEFLFVDLDNDNRYNSYDTPRPEAGQTGPEVFKYLSMCYVLAAVGDVGTGSAAAGAGLDISFEYENGQRFTVADPGLENVPLQRNWNTNVVLAGDMIYPQESGASTLGALRAGLTRVVAAASEVR